MGTLIDSQWGKSAGDTVDLGLASEWEGSLEPPTCTQVVRSTGKSLGWWLESKVCVLG